MQKKAEDKFIFEKKIDKSINGLALVFSFIIMGIILQFDNSFFGNGTDFIKIVFIGVGILGLFTEISKMNISYNIKGLDDIEIGLFLIVICYFLKRYIKINLVVIDIIFQTMLFFLILLSIFGFAKGIIEMIYSLYINYKEKNKKGNLFSSIIVVLTQLFGLALMIAQIYDIFK